MDAIPELKAAIERALNLHKFEHPGVIPAFRAEVDALEKLLKGAGRDSPSLDRTRAAVMEFRETDELRSLAIARAVCFGACERFDGPEPALIEERDRFPRLLNLVDAYKPEPRSYRRCFRGLLHSYISYDSEHKGASTEGRANWERLRDYLHGSHRNIVCDELQPDWVECISQHPNLLTADPVNRYAAALLRGERAVVEEIRLRLDVNDKHWLMRKLILAQIHSATRESDATFAGLVESLIGLLEGHEGLEDEGLGLIINRYATSQNPVLHPGLRDRTVKSWGNPWIDRHLPRWRHTTSAARTLVTAWFKLHVIRTFFELMSDDGEVDQRRVKFWQQYYEQIDDMYFALGSTAQYSRKPDVKQMRADMGDRLLGLRNGGKSSNNAFIMMMGDLVAVEFGVTGHACFLYRRNLLPFELRREVSGSTSSDGLRSSSHLERLTHHDTSYGKWETAFEDVLRRHGTSRTTRSTPRDPQASSSRSLALTRQALREFCSEHGASWRDHTDRDGNLAVLYPQSHGVAADQLRGWGFKYSDLREFWWRKNWP